MAKLHNVDPNTVKQLQENIEAYANGSTLQEAFQKTVSTLYENFKESIVLARIYQLMTYKDLPESDKRFVTNLATNLNIADKIQNESPVLSLMATAGKESKWNNRENSSGHLGIPFISEPFVRGIPMMLALLQATGLEIPGVGKLKADVAMPFFNQGVFLVEDATKEMDDKGRLIIPAQDFVKEHNVKSVLGFGHAEVLHNTFTVALFFVSDSLDKNNWKIKNFSNLMTISLKKIAKNYLVAKKYYPNKKDIYA
jgi:hypothetical protein